MCSVPGSNLRWPGQGWALKGWVSWEEQARERPPAKQGKLDKCQWRADTKGAWSERTGTEAVLFAFGLKDRKHLNKQACKERGVVTCDGGGGGASLIWGVSASPSLLVTLDAHVNVLSPCFFLCALIPAFPSIVVFCRPRLILDQSMWLIFSPAWVAQWTL